MIFRLCVAAVVCTLTSLPVRAADGTEKSRVPEAVEMFVSILKNGAEMGPGSAWFHPSTSRYGWSWLAPRMDANGDGGIIIDEFLGSPRLFNRLDRDGDGAITAEDLDWTGKSVFLQTKAYVRGRFAAFDRNANGRISREEWEKVFDAMAKGKNFLAAEDLIDVLYPQARPAPRESKPGRTPPDMPSRWTLLKGLFSGEIGSMTEGPNVGEPAPDFTLTTVDEEKQISLADFKGKKPVVLIFGSFT